jgi:hypothetical protein
VTVGWWLLDITERSGRGRAGGTAPAASAQLKAWKILAELHCCPLARGELAKAVHVWQLREA